MVQNIYPGPTSSFSVPQMLGQLRAWRTTAAGIHCTGPVTQPPPSLAILWTRAALWPITATLWSLCLEKTTREPLCWTSVRSESLILKLSVLRSGPSSNSISFSFPFEQRIYFSSLNRDFYTKTFWELPLHIIILVLCLFLL